MAVLIGHPVTVQRGLLLFDAALDEKGVPNHLLPLVLANAVRNGNSSVYYHQVYQRVSKPDGSLHPLFLSALSFTLDKNMQQQAIDTWVSCFTLSCQVPLRTFINIVQDMTDSSVSGSQSVWKFIVREWYLMPSHSFTV